MYTLQLKARTRALAQAFTFVLGIGVFSAAAPAEDILITSGSVDVHLSYVAIDLAGERSFTFAGYQETDFPTGCCYSPGLRISLEKDLTAIKGTATLDGNIYRADYFIDRPDATLRLRISSSSVVLPPYGAATSIAVPFVLTGTFTTFTETGSQPGPPLPGPPRSPVLQVGLIGHGVATISLTPDLTGKWSIQDHRYDIGTRLPAPWQSTDVGNVGLAGRASMLVQWLVVAGNGGDIWAHADGFRFAYQTLSGRGAVMAHVRATTDLAGAPTYPVASANEFAKAGVMLRQSTDPGAPHVILDVKPDGGLEFMVRYAARENTHFIAGAAASADDVWLQLVRDGTQVVASHSADGIRWTSLGTAMVPFADEILAGLAVTSHQSDSLHMALFDHVSVSGQSPNLLVNGDFEAYEPPSLGAPGWISDHAFRQAPAKSETHQPRSGAKNGACWTPEYLDCGIYQDVIAPATGTYSYTVYASADRAGGLVGANVNGLLAGSLEVGTARFGDYSRYTMTFAASAGEVIRVWMYSPASPGYVVIDDAILVFKGE